MDNPLQASLAELTSVQRQAVDWEDGPLLVLTGPGSGKTRVLTCRIARLLDSSPDRRFRILALTFTNKAANEMAGRVSALVPGPEGRTNIGTFHGFCAHALRQHGVHLGIRSDFAIYSQTKDRQAVLEDALGRDSARDWSRGYPRLLPLIDYLKTRLVEPDLAERYVGAMNGSVAANASRIARAYRLYEDELRRINALDFDSLILDAYRLFSYPAMADQYRRTYRYWLIDEFQDTNSAQYKLLRRMAGQDFHNVFAVADDDQTIFEWNGANVQRISNLVKDFSCDVVQLPTNFRCPPLIVEAANRLVVYNSRRIASKQLAKPARVPGRSPSSGEDQIRCREFDTNEDEVAGIAEEIACLDAAARSGTAVLARTRFLLEVACFKVWTDAVREVGVPDSVADMVNAVADLSAGKLKLTAAIEQILGHFDNNDLDGDLKDDISAWRRIQRDIKAAQGFASLDRFLQELQLRSKEPTPTLGTVSLTTIHGAKGRRGCFVAVTRTGKRLVLSRARHYRGWPKEPSRFLKEMGCLESEVAGSGSQGIGRQ